MTIQNSFLNNDNLHYRGVVKENLKTSLNLKLLKNLKFIKATTVMGLVLLPFALAEAQSNWIQRVGNSPPTNNSPAITSRFTLKQDLGYIYNFAHNWNKTIISGSGNSGNITASNGHSFGYGASFNWSASFGFGLTADYIGFKNRWTIKDPIYNINTNYTADYHVVSFTPSYRVSMDKADNWGFRVGLGLGFTVSDLSYNIADAAGYRTGGYTYVAQKNLQWTQPGLVTPIGTITNSTPVSFSNRIESSRWQNVPIPQADNPATDTKIQTQKLTLFNGNIAPTIGSTIKPYVPFATEYAGSLIVDTDLPKESGYSRLRMTLNTIHFPGTPNAIETKRYFFQESIREGLFNIDLRIFNSYALLPPNQQPGSNGEYPGNIPIKLELTLEYFGAPNAGGTAIHNFNQSSREFAIAPVLIPDHDPNTNNVNVNTKADLTLTSAAVNFSQVNPAGKVVGQDITATADNKNLGFIITPQIGFEYDNGFLHVDLNARYMHSLLPISYEAVETSGNNIGTSKVTYEQKEGPLAFFLGAGIGIIF